MENTLVQPEQISQQKVQESKQKVQESKQKVQESQQKVQESQQKSQQKENESQSVKDVNNKEEDYNDKPNRGMVYNFNTGLLEYFTSKYSSCAYIGLLEELIKLRLKNDMYVLGCEYTTIDKYGRIVNDVQVCFGGSIDNNELPINAFKRESGEELRCYMVDDNTMPVIRKKTFPNLQRVDETHIYANHVSKFHALNAAQYAVFCKKTKKTKSKQKKKVVGIIYGTYSELQTFVRTLPINCAINDDITGIAILPVQKALEMLKYAYKRWDGFYVADTN